MFFAGKAFSTVADIYNAVFGWLQPLTSRKCEKSSVNQI